MADPLSKTSENDERRLWFDYIKTLNERQLHNAQRTGITAYVLVATLLGIVYRFGPVAPVFLNDRDKVNVCLRLFVFETILFVNSARIVLSLFAYSTGASEFRAQPRTYDAASRVYFGVSTIIALAFAYLTIKVAHSIASLSSFGRWFLYLWAVSFVADMAYPAFYYFRPTKKAGKLRRPRFPLIRLSPAVSSVNFVLSLAFTFIVAKLFIAYVDTAPGYWVQCLKAASISLLFITIICFIFLRIIYNSQTQRYFGLEREIVVNKLTAAEIRSKYLQELSGPDMVQWLEDALATVDEKEGRLQRAQDLAQQKLEEVTKISAEYVVERKERAKRVIEDLTEAFDDCLSQHELLTSQTETFTKIYRTKEETDALKEKGDLALRKFEAFKNKKAERFAIIDELKKIAEKP